MNNSTVSLLIALGSLCWLCLNSEASQPNILFIFSDNHRHDVAELSISTNMDGLNNAVNHPAYAQVKADVVQARDEKRDSISIDDEPKRDQRPLEISGIYPSLAMFNDENECGTGAVVPWADRLWVITYAPHKPTGSTDKLYEITPSLKQIIRPESIGGTPANRMIHRESEQLFIGPYAIDAKGNVRVIPYAKMFGRPTGNARHLTDPENKIYYASMEEGIYEVDVHSLEVTELWTDEQVKASANRKTRHARLPGYHGKGLYSGQGRLIYANNGEHGSEARRRPDVPSGVLAEWTGLPADWSVVRRNQFTEVTGPGGIYGNSNPASDPVWTIGWDHRSLILMVLHQGKWYSFRLPKSSHSYDGAHGWNTEWPRIRDIGEEELLMTMHGAFWRFPRGFRPGYTQGIKPRSNYLKVIGDFCQWKDRLVFGCDDTAKNEFLNKRKAKGEIAAPQSQSNLWFVDPDHLDALGPVIGRGGVWVREDVDAGTVSDPFLVDGYDHGGLHLSHHGKEVTLLTVEQDVRGNGQWTTLAEVSLDPQGYRFLPIEPGPVWLRIRSTRRISKATAWFHLSKTDSRSNQAGDIFEGLASVGDQRIVGGLIRGRGGNKRTLSLAAMVPTDNGVDDVGYYELTADLRLTRVDAPSVHAFTKNRTRIPSNVLEADEASVIFIDDNGKRWRLPRSHSAFDMQSPMGPCRVAREVATERDLFSAYGTFFELPAENAGGFAKVRPVATHNFQVHDFCSYRGLFIMSGVTSKASTKNPHIIRSDDGRSALWVGAIDDVWRMGKVRGYGGTWKNTDVKAGQPSDPYLMTGYDRKSLSISHDANGPVTIGTEIDVTGDGHWINYRSFDVQPGQELDYDFPNGFSGYWIRTIASTACKVTVQLRYE